MEYRCHIKTGVAQYSLSSNKSVSASLWVTKNVPLSNHFLTDGVWEASRISIAAFTARTSNTTYIISNQPHFHGIPSVINTFYPTRFLFFFRYLCILWPDFHKYLCICRTFFKNICALSDKLFLNICESSEQIFKKYLFIVWQFFLNICGSDQIFF